MDSILETVKKSMGAINSSDFFDPEIIVIINSLLSTLNQVGVGPKEGYSIEDETATWDDFMGSDPRLSFVRSYVCIKARLIFDPPQSSSMHQALNEEAEELLWRISANVDPPLK